MFPSLNDHFLLAMPTLADPNFAQAVTYVCEHTENGAMGLIVNRSADLTLGDILQQLELTTNRPEIANTPVYYGGPVQQDCGFILHRPAAQWESSLRVTDDIAITTSRDILAALAAGEGPTDFLITLGYAGWGAGQLEQEVADNAWLTAPADSAILFHTPLAKRWHSAARLIGVDPSRLSTDTGHA